MSLSEETIALPVAPSSFELRLLDPKQIKVFTVTGVTRMTESDRSWIKVSSARAFPLSDPDHYIGLLDINGKDVGMIYDPALLDSESRATVTKDLERRYFVPTVERILHVKEEFGTIYWTVETDKGEIDIIVRNLRDNLQELSPTRVIITDIHGNRYEFNNLQRFDNKTQSIILRNL
ncbi:MAG: DUF1854 domain-containing protein [Armatimonadetes bacterium]|nr:DUF1854 domain-containing protein [Armatimonadota bacterium]